MGDSCCPNSVPNDPNRGYGGRRKNNLWNKITARARARSEMKKNDGVKIAALVVAETKAAIRIDAGGTAQKCVWMPRSIIIDAFPDKKHPELTIFTLPDWYANKEGLSKPR